MEHRRARAAAWAVDENCARGVRIGGDEAEDCFEVEARAAFSERVAYESDHPPIEDQSDDPEIERGGVNALETGLKDAQQRAKENERGECVNGEREKDDLEYGALQRVPVVCALQALPQTYRGDCRRVDDH